MAAFLDACRFSPTAGGLTDWTYSAIVTGYQSPASAGVVNGMKYKYRAESTTPGQWEIGEGAYNTSTGVLARTTVLSNSSGSTSLINFTLTPQVAIVALAEDMISIEQANAFTATQQAQARTNIAALGSVKIQKFTASGTYTPSTGMLYCTIEAVGGGAGAGGATDASGTQTYASGGGGSGGYSRLTATAGAIGASKTVTIGAGGAGGTVGAGVSGGQTSVGTLCIANGGIGSGNASVSAVSAGGAGGAPGTGDITAAGSPGGGGWYASSTTGSYLPTAGHGGSSVFGGGGAGASTGAVSGAGGAAGSNYGGGGGGSVLNTGVGTATGGAGSAGVVIITEFCVPV